MIHKTATLTLTLGIFAIASAATAQNAILPLVRTPDAAFQASPQSFQKSLFQVEADGFALMHVSGMTQMAGERRVTFGDITIGGAFARATLPNQPVAGGFMMLRNDGSTDDRLVGASSDIAGHMEVHEMAMDGDVMKMRELPEGLLVPAGEEVELKPGGYHLMFMELKGPLVEGETVDVILTFENAGDVVVSLGIQAPNARMQHGHGMGHGNMNRSGSGTGG